MEKRRIKRVACRHFVRVLKRAGVLENISVNGLRVVTSRLPGSKVVKITVSLDGKPLKIRGTLRWARDKGDGSNLKILGVRVNSAPKEYRQFVNKRLQEDCWHCY
ncbi:MAG: PilZ domain-containing protein [bacterium]|nr:PilZ domain-containing protein [bacterium]